jgi:DNA primase
MNCNDINQLDPIELLSKFNIKPISQNGNEYKYHSPFREDYNPSLSVNRHKRVWVDFGTGMKGKNVDLLLNIYKTTSVSDMMIRFNKEFTQQSFSFSQLKKKRIQKPLTKTKILKVVTLKSKALLKYLKKRGVSQEVWEKYLVEISYLINDKVGYGIGFKNDANGFEVRNELMKFCIGKKDITTISGAPDEVVVFEGFFDFLSFVELGLYDNQTAIVLNSTVNTSRLLERALKLLPDANIETYLDNDAAGLKALEMIMEVYPNVSDQSNLYKQCKDLNEMLQRSLPKNKGFSL